MTLLILQPEVEASFLLSEEKYDEQEIEGGWVDIVEASQAECTKFDIIEKLRSFSMLQNERGIIVSSFSLALSPDSLGSYTVTVVIDKKYICLAPLAEAEIPWRDPNSYLRGLLGSGEFTLKRYFYTENIDGLKLEEEITFTIIESASWFFRNDVAKNRFICTAKVFFNDDLSMPIEGCQLSNTLFDQREDMP